MYEFNAKLRVRYAETDQMGYCYYGNYAQYFEVARVETLRSLDLSYKELAALAVPAAFLFGAASLPAGWLGDRWSKTKLLEIFFYGTGIFTILTGFANTPLMLGEFQD